MAKIMAFFRLIRWSNLLIIFLTQLLIWLCVICPLSYGQSNVSLFLNCNHFILLSLTTVLIAAAGYIINDYYDRAIDAINKPDKVIVGRILSLKQTLICYIVLNLIALSLTAYLSHLQQCLSLMSIQVLCVFLLWIYAAYLKRKLILGNVAVALLTALTILILLAYEPELYPYFNISGIIYQKEIQIINPIFIILVYAFFAFMTTWIREMIKDMQDMKGDEAAACRTLPLVYGVFFTSRFVVVLGVISILVLGFFANAILFFGWRGLAFYVIFAMVLPLAILCFQITKKNTIKHFAQWSSLSKIIMLFGILSLPLYYFLTFVY